MRRLIAIADVINVTVAAALSVVLLACSVRSAADLCLVPFAFGLVFGFFAADVASGLMHWFCDTYSHPGAPLIGPMLIAPFREHHVDPTALVRHGVFERNGNNCLASLPLLLMALWSIEPTGATRAWHDFQSGFLNASSLTLCLTNQIHTWAHCTTPPHLVGWLQRMGVLLTPERHHAHHRGERAYAVVSGWSNPWLDRLLPRAEALLGGLRRPPAGPGGNS